MIKKNFGLGCAVLHRKKSKKIHMCKMEKIFWMRRVLNSHHLACKDGALDHSATKVIYLYCVTSELIKQVISLIPITQRPDKYKATGLGQRGARLSLTSICPHNFIPSRESGFDLPKSPKHCQNRGRLKI